MILIFSSNSFRLHNIFLIGVINVDSLNGFLFTNSLFDDHLFNIDKADSKTIKLKEGERRMVSILFADIKGFTALSEKLDHEKVQSLMDQLMNQIN